jgi:hypothetical protein
MNTYEVEQIKAIARWKREKPGVASQVFDYVTAPMTWLVAKVIPIALVQRAVEGADFVAQSFTDSEDILRDGEVSSIDELRTKSLRLSDQLADEVHNWAIAVSGAGGTVLGATGFGGVALDIAALFTLSLRTTHKIGLCYGYPQVNEQLVWGVLSVSSAANRNERKSSIELMGDIETMVIEDVWEDITKDAVLTRVARGGTFFTTRQAGKRWGRNLAKRKSLQLVPVVGAVLSGATNISVLTDVGWAARRVFQERWLIDNGRIPVEAAKKERRKKTPAKEEKPSSKGEFNGE